MENYRRNKLWNITSLKTNSEPREKIEETWLKVKLMTQKQDLEVNAVFKREKEKF